MFNVGGSELVLVAILALLLIPPKKLPGVAESLARLYGQLQRGVKDIKDNVQTTLKESHVESITKNITDVLDKPNKDSKEE